MARQGRAGPALAIAAIGSFVAGTLSVVGLMFLAPPLARFALIGHIHRPGCWRLPNGVVVLNTGSFCPPLGAALIDVRPTRLTLRAVVRRRGEFRPGAVLAEFPLGPAA